MRRLAAGIAIGVLGFAAAAWATPSGLDNIPTADTVPDRIAVIQAYDTFGDSAKHDFSAGLKFGIEPWREKLATWSPRFEGGLDSSLFPGRSGPIVFQGKVAVQPWEQLPALSLGSANLALSDADRRSAGEPFSYLVLSEDLKFLRLHGGYALQAHNDAALLGIDTTFHIPDHDWTVRADATQTNHQHFWVTSVGTMYVLTKNIVLEAWSSFPVDHGVVNFTLKLNWVIGN